MYIYTHAIQYVVKDFYQICRYGTRPPRADRVRVQVTCEAPNAEMDLQPKQSVVQDFHSSESHTHPMKPECPKPPKY